MTEKSEYAVLRFIAQGNYCHVVHDYVQGYNIMEYAKENIILEKRKIFTIIKKLAKQMEEFYKCEEEAYGYLNPYALILTESEEILLLDIWAEENKEYVAMMQKKKIRALFVNPEHLLSQKKRKEDDLYGYGKSVQFLIEKCCTKNSFTYKETKIIKNIYGKCLNGEKAETGKWITIQKMADKLLFDKKESKNFGEYIVLLLGGLFILAVGIWLGMQGTKEKYLNQEKEEQTVIKMKDEFELEKAEKYLEIGLLCLKMKDEDADLWLERATENSELAKIYVEINEYMQKEILLEDEKEALEKILNESLDLVHSSDSYIFKLPFLRGYAKIDRESAWEQVIFIGKNMESTVEVKLYLARAYDAVDNFEAAIIAYEDLKQIYFAGEELKVVYMKLMELYDLVGLPEKVKENYEEAVTLMPKLEKDEDFLKWKEVFETEEEVEKTEVLEEADS